MSSKSRFPIALAAVCLISAFGAASGASAQTYYYYEQPPMHRHYRPAYQPPVYVPPRVLRKQAQQRQRFIERYGYQAAPSPYYGGPGYYGGPRYYGGPGYYHQPRRPGFDSSTSQPGAW